MTQEIAIAERESRENEGAKGAEILITVVSGFEEERDVSMPEGRRPVEIVETFAAERGCNAEELVLIMEGGEEPVAIDLVIGADYPADKRHHVHHRGPVEAIVFYQNADKHHEFRRHKTVNDVLAWAINKFGIDPALATEFELTRRGDKTPLPGTEHIGHVAGHHKKVELDLVRGDIANGRAA